MILAIALLAQAITSPTRAGGIPELHNCKFTSSTGNVDGYGTMSETYTCDEGDIKLNGLWYHEIENGYTYSLQMGRLEGEAHKTTAWEWKFFKWCKTDTGTFRTCGLSDDKGAR